MLKTNNLELALKMIYEIVKRYSHIASVFVGLNIIEYLKKIINLQTDIGIID